MSFNQLEFPWLSLTAVWQKLDYVIPDMTPYFDKCYDISSYDG